MSKIIMCHTFQIMCDCGCGGMIRFDFHTDEDNDHYIEVGYWHSAFYFMQERIWQNAWKRIKLAWMMIRGKQYHLYDVIVNDKELADFKDWASKLQ